MSHRGLAILALLLASPGLAAEDARYLASELSCLACHQASTKDTYLPPKRGPVLDGVGARLRSAWIRSFLTDPHKTHPETTMPDMIAHLPEAVRSETVENLTHYLLSDGGKRPSTPRNADPIGGQMLHKTIGCAACHSSEAPDVSHKYTFGSLTALLLDPLAVRPDGRMPSLDLSRDEAADIAAYWLRMEPTAPEPENHAPLVVNTEQVAAGKEAFETLRCASCHTRKGMETPPPVETPFMPEPGCEGPPHYTLTTSQREILSATTTPAPFTPTSRLHANLEAFQCTACHDRVGTKSPSSDHFTGDELLGDAGRLPPSLTNAGRKLRHAWMTQVLEGKKRYRPYLNTRMPLYGMTNVRHLPDLFAHADNAPFISTATDSYLKEGHQLVGTVGGMGCITCHAWKENPGVAMHGPSISNIDERLHFDWFKDYLINPQSVRPNTLMPSFWPDGKSGNPNVLDGNTDQQIAAIWTFLNKGTETPLGIPNPGSREFEIIPMDKPIVQRGFVQNGEKLHTSAIAVGFPNKANFLYDAATCKPVIAWEGRFLDGYPLWFSRMNPSVTLPENAIAIPSNIPQHVAVETPARFKGYRIDPNSGMPTFLSETTNFIIEEKINANLERSLVIIERQNPNSRQEIEAKIEL